MCVEFRRVLRVYSSEDRAILEEYYFFVILKIKIYKALAFKCSALISYFPMQHRKMFCFDFVFSVLITKLTYCFVVFNFFSLIHIVENCK